MSSDSSFDVYSDETCDVDEESPCLPTNDDTLIHLPDYMSISDQLHVNEKFVRARDREEQAKSIARLYRDRYTQLTTKVAELQLEQAKLKSNFTNEKNRIRSFWRDKILEGRSRSGQILQLALKY